MAAQCGDLVYPDDVGKPIELVVPATLRARGTRVAASLSTTAPSEHCRPQPMVRQMVAGWRSSAYLAWT